MKILVLLVLGSMLTSGCSTTQITSTSGVEAANANTAASYEILLASDIQWGDLNPARGHNSPRAGNLWGDRASSGATGFLVKFKDGFSSPPHIHNVTYRGLVIDGLVHNDDPGAEVMWMPPGSFWTQPAGELHITAAKGNNNIAYIEIQQGPYLVLPSKDAFDNGQRPINMDQSNINWLDASDIKWINQPEMPATGDGIKVAFLWGNRQIKQPNGLLVKLPAGFTGTIHSQSKSFRAVVIQGQLEYQSPGVPGNKTLDAGSYFGSNGNTTHHIASHAQDESTIYIRTDGKLNINASNTK